MSYPWSMPLGFFALFNLVGAPILGHLTWDGMLRLRAGEQVFAAAGLSLVTSLVILGVNIALFRWAKRMELPRPLQMALFLITGLTFLMPIGTGHFSPVNLIASLLG